MNELNKDITRVIISNDDIQEYIGSIFPDSVILDTQFNFVSVSQNILDATEYSHNDLVGSSISCFCNSFDLQKLLEEKLRPGYFNNEEVEIRTKSDRKITYSISGFYLGLIADVNGLIVFKFRNLDEINLVHEKIEAKTVELDRFVYLSAHALRGPLATIKGLVNIGKVSNDKEELNFIMTQIETFAEKLDDKLHRLIYFAESDKAHESSASPLSISEIVKSLEDGINEGVIGFPVIFENHSKDQKKILHDGEVILSLLRNITSFFGQRQKLIDNRLILDIHKDHNSIEMVVRARGFVFDDSLREKLKSINFGYSEILNYPELINCYAAKKIIFKLKGSMHFVLYNADEIIVLMTCPSNF